MTRFDRYLLRELLPPLAFGLLLYAGLAVVSAVLPRLQWMVGVPIWDVAGWIALLLPQALVQTAPVALVLAVLLAFGRLSHDNELTAARAGGVPMLRAAGLCLLLGTVAAASTLAMNEWLVPRSNAAVADTYWRLTAGRSGLFRLAAQRLPVQGFSFSFASVSRDGTMEDVRVERWEGEVLTIVRAQRARFDGLDLVLQGHRTQRLDLSALDADDLEPVARLRALVRLDARGSSQDAPLVLSTGMDEGELVARFSAGGFEDARSLSRLWGDARDPGASVSERREAATLWHRKLAEPVSNLALLVMAVPLSITFARSRAIAFGLALAVTLAWYVLYVFGQLLSVAGLLPVWAGPWAANALAGALGLWWVLRLGRR